MISHRSPDDGQPTVDDLDAALAGLRNAVVFPPTPEFGPAVSRTITTAPVVMPRAARSVPALGWPRGIALVGLALILLLGAALAHSGDLRAAVADRLGLPGIRIELVAEAPVTQ